MAVEELEYFAPTVGNGMRTATMEAKPSRGRVATAKKSRSGSATGRMLPFVQGLTLGVVLMIPFGVWWWAQSPGATPAADPVGASPAVSKAKSAKAAVPKKRVVRTAPTGSAAAANVPYRIDDGGSPERANTASSGVPIEVRPGPRPIASETPSQRTLPTPLHKSKPKITGVEEQF